MFFFLCFGTKTVPFLESESCARHGVTLVYTSSVFQALKQYNVEQAEQQNAVSGKVDGNRNPRKLKTCFSCGQEGQLSQGKRSLVQGQACRKCGVMGHFKVKWLQL